MGYDLQYYEHGNNTPHTVGEDDPMPVEFFGARVPMIVDLVDAAPAAVARVALTDTSEQTLVAAPVAGSGKRIYVYYATGGNAGASVSTVDLKEGAGGTKQFSHPMGANGGGFTEPLPFSWALPVETALVVQQSAAVVSYVTVQYRVAR